MSLIFASDLPKFSQEHASQIAFGLYSSNQALVVYEGHRDFLSAPRSFIVLEIQLCDEIILSTGGNFLDDSQWADLHNSDYGIYQVVNSALLDQPQHDVPQPNDSPDKIHWLCYTPQLIVEFSAVKLTAKSPIYHQESVFSVLAKAASVKNGVVKK